MACSMRVSADGENARRTRHDDNPCGDNRWRKRRDRFMSPASRGPATAETSAAATESTATKSTAGGASQHAGTTK